MDAILTTLNLGLTLAPPNNRMTIFPFFYIRGEVIAKADEKETIIYSDISKLL